MEPITPLAQALQAYGPWSIVALLVLALTWVSKAYVSVRDKHETELKEIALNSVKLVERCTEVNTTATACMDRIADAIVAFERRLEDVERSRP